MFNAISYQLYMIAEYSVSNLSQMLQLSYLIHNILVTDTCRVRYSPPPFDVKAISTPLIFVQCFTFHKGNPLDDVHKV